MCSPHANRNPPPRTAQVNFLYPLPRFHTLTVEQGLALL